MVRGRPQNSNYLDLILVSTTPIPLNCQLLPPGHFTNGTNDAKKLNFSLNTIIRRRPTPHPHSLLRDDMTMRLDTSSSSCAHTGRIRQGLEPEFGAWSTPMDAKIHLWKYSILCMSLDTFSFFLLLSVLFFSFLLQTSCQEVLKFLNLNLS